MLTSSLIARARSDTFVADSSDQSLWLLCTRPDPQHGDVILFTLLGEKGEFIIPRAVVPQVGVVRWTGVRGRRLHVIYGDDGTHMGYSPETGASPEAWLPDRHVPEAVAADSIGDQLYAVVPTWLAAKIRVPASAPSPRPAATSAPFTPAKQSAENRYSIVSYRRGRWIRTAQIPDELLPEEPRFFPAVVAKTLHLLAVAPEGGPIRHATFANGRWSRRPSFGQDWTVRPVRLLAVPVGTRGQLVLLVTGPPDRAGHVTLRFARYAGDRWTLSGPVAGDAATPSFAAEDFTAAVIEDRIALFRRQTDGRVFFAQADLDGRLVKPFRSIRALEPVSKPALSPKFKDWAALVVLGIIMIVLFWQRQDSIVTPVELPSGARLAELWRRGLGLVIDLFLVAIVTVAMCRKAVTAENIPWGRLIADPSVISASLYGASWFGRVIHVLYCGCFEALLGKTPGKMITRCRVTDHFGQGPTLKQVSVRNIARLIEFEPLLSIWWVVILVLLTRNRQRLGDILAKTVVVRPDTTSSTAGDDAPSED